MNIANIPFSLLSIEAVLDLAVRSSDLIAKRHPGDVLLEKVLADLQEPMRNARLAIARITGKEMTREVNDANYKRDQIFIGFRMAVGSHTHDEDDPVAKKAAENILEIISRHGTQLYTKGMTVQSSLLASLFEDMESTKASADLTVLGLNSHLDRLKAAQAEFALVQAERNELEKARDIPTSVVARAELIDKLSIVFNGLDFLSNADPDTYKETTELVEQLADGIVSAERKRRRDRVEAGETEAVGSVDGEATEDGESTVDSVV